MSTYAKERDVAISAVLKACFVARSVQHRLINEETATKSDKSPVTGSFPLCETLYCLR